MQVPVVPGLSRRDIEIRATLLLKESEQLEAVRGGNPVDIETIFELYIPGRYRVETGYTDLNFLGPGVLGYTDASKRISCVDKSLSDSDDTPTRRRFRSTVGHEAGHCIYHVSVLSFFKSSLLKGNVDGLYRAERAQIPAFKDPEWQAWEFARACLMPHELVLKYCERSYSLRDMAKCFDVNPRFIEVRLDTLKIKPF